jgi:hypothetical protein
MGYTALVGESEGTTMAARVTSREVDPPMDDIDHSVDKCLGPPDGLGSKSTGTHQYFGKCACR